jgi:hypothetical protein
VVERRLDALRVQALDGRHRFGGRLAGDETIGRAPRKAEAAYETPGPPGIRKEEEQ